MNSTGPSPSQYPFDNAAPQAGDRFVNLAALYDCVTLRHLDRFGIGAGWHCLEVGAGGGSVARALSERVGPNGRVIATDINTDWMTGSMPANVELRRQDIGIDPLPEAAFDLVHARAVLTFVPRRLSALTRMIQSLKPGGWLLVEEMVTPITEGWDRPDDPDFDLARKGRRAIMEVIRRQGGDLNFAVELARHLKTSPLTEVGAEGFFVPFRSDAVAGLAKANIDQLRSAIIETGAMDADEIDRYRATLERPDGLYPASMALISAWGRR
jgi:SAM-dependent methyltransferase